MAQTSILNDVKKTLGIESSYTQFDADILMHINTAIQILKEIGIAPNTNFYLTDASQTWDQYYTNIQSIPAIKTYIYQKVRLIFDPPQSQIHVDALKQSIQELEWRINSEVDWKEEETTT